MASTFNFIEDNGARTNLKGATRSGNVTNCNWKNVDDCVSAYGSYPITAGNRSFVKYQAGAIGGTFNQLSNGKWGHTTGTFGAGIYLSGFVSTGYFSPNTGDITGANNITTPSGLASAYFAVNFGGEPHQATSGTMAVTGYTAYFVTQMVTETGAAAGDTATGTFTFSYDES